MITAADARNILRLVGTDEEGRIRQLEEELRTSGMSGDLHPMREILQMSYYHPYVSRVLLRWQRKRERAMQTFKRSLGALLQGDVTVSLAECEYLFRLMCAQNVLPITVVDKESLAEYLARRADADEDPGGACEAIIAYCGDGTTAVALASEMLARYIDPPREASHAY